MMYLLDTNVLSEFRKATTGKIDSNVHAWAEATPDLNMYLSAITLPEVEVGILRIERRDQSQGLLLQAWMDEHVLRSFEGRVLAFDALAALQCARLQVPNPRSERDAMIAATALVHSMTVVTRNVSHFESTGVQILDPWKG
jgi:predicted nucleic acid-binding protein